MVFYLTVISSSLYLNFSAWFVKKMLVLFEQKKVKLWNKQHCMENKTDDAACLKSAVNILVAEIHTINF